MGYRSEWKLAINTASNATLNRALHMMSDYSTNGGIDQDRRDVMECILQCEISKGDTWAEFGDDYTKCGYPWDSVIDDIFEMAEQDEEIDAAYACIGEDYNDTETRDGDWTYVYINRSISDVDYGDVPEHKEKQVVNIPAPTQEEKCGCGKMKDAGQPCWWCGG